MFSQVDRTIDKVFARDKLFTSRPENVCACGLFRALAPLNPKFGGLSAPHGTTASTKVAVKRARYCRVIASGIASLTKLLSQSRVGLTANSLRYPKRSWEQSSLVDRLRH